MKRKKTTLRSFDAWKNEDHINIDSQNRTHDCQRSLFAGSLRILITLGQEAPWFPSISNLYT